MWRKGEWQRAARGAMALAFAGLAAGCFQPLYGQFSTNGTPLMREQLSAVNVEQISAPKGTDEPVAGQRLRQPIA
jgi:LPS-assembly lipoprotein